MQGLSEDARDHVAPTVSEMVSLTGRVLPMQRHRTGGAIALATVG
jgi:hypothetical protein